VGIVVEEHAAIAVNAILLAKDAKPMQMQVLPAHGDLENGMQLTDGSVGGHKEATPSYPLRISARNTWPGCNPIEAWQWFVLYPWLHRPHRFHAMGLKSSTPAEGAQR
jgi:hypothetical protein